MLNAQLNIEGKLSYDRKFTLGIDEKYAISRIDTAQSCVLLYTHLYTLYGWILSSATVSEQTQHP